MSVIEKSFKFNITKYWVNGKIAAESHVQIQKYLSTFWVISRKTIVNYNWRLGEEWIPLRAATRATS